VDLAASDAYELRLSAPAGLLPGTRYELLVSNGAGGAAGETSAEQSVLAIAAGADYFRLDVPWAAKFDFYHNVYNVKTDARLRQKAVGDGVSNDQPALQAAINQAAAAGGGVVYVPAGTYKLVYTSVSGLEIPSRVVVQGAGPELTQLRYGYGAATGFGYAVGFLGNAQRVGVADLSLENVNEQGRWEHNLCAYPGTLRDAFLSNVHLRFSGEALTLLQPSERVLLQGCRLISRHNPLASLQQGPLVVESARYFTLRNCYLLHEVWQTGFNDNCQNLLVEGNTFVRDAAILYSAHKPTIETRTLSINFAQDVALLRNRFETIHGPAPDNNDGETLLNEGGGPHRKDAYYGRVSGAGASSLQDASASWGALTSQAVVVLIAGKGQGQWRRITASTGQSLTLERGWDVVPDASTRYSITDWSARNWLVKENTLVNNRAGLEFWSCSTLDVAVVGNRLTNNDGILLRPGQTLIQGAQVFNMVYNTQLVENWVENVEAAANTGAPAYIGLLPYQYGVSQSVGTAAIGVEVRRNTLLARPSYTPSYANNNQLGQEGYYNYFLVQYIGAMSEIPVTLGTIFQHNTARNTANAFYLSSGAHNTLLCATTLANVGNLVQDKTLLNATKASVNTVRECLTPISSPPSNRLRPIADPKTNAPIPRNGGATRVLPLTGSAPSGFITGFTITELPAAGQGTLYLGAAPLPEHASLTVEQGQQLSFAPHPGFTGEGSFTYAAVDDHDVISLEAAFRIPVTSPLPVVLTQFTAQARNADALLTWATAAEPDHCYFAVERSRDAKRFETVGRLCSAGTSATGATYTFLDYNPGASLAGPVYYRLRQVDLDSTTAYSAVRAVRFADAAPGHLSIYPNPTADELRVLLPTAGGRLRVYSPSGLLLLETHIATAEGALDVRHLPAGAYLLLVQPDHGALEQHSFIKEKS
jgi:hypothetical protein